MAAIRMCNYSLRRNKNEEVIISLVTMGIISVFANTTSSTELGSISISLNIKRMRETGVHDIPSK